MVLGLSKLFSVTPEKVAAKLRPQAELVNKFEPALQRLSDEELRAKTAEFRKRLADGELLDILLPEAFACVREASRRTTGMRHFDVQIMGGIVLHEGKIAEMRTGEGKTLVATLPLYLSALTGQGAHLVTVNDYLARRDVQWMGPIYHTLGVTVGCLQHESAFVYDSQVTAENPSMRRLRSVPRRQAYAADITYGTNHEFGFDYLRDNMVIDASQQVQRKQVYAIVDEVDYILIDEARTPLIISGPAQESTDVYQTVARLVPRLQRKEDPEDEEAEGDFTVDEKHRGVALLDSGIDKMERALGIVNLYAPENGLLVHHVENALKAMVLFRKDRDYVVTNGEIIIVDEFTGRLMPGRRWSDGLHQAVEAKEGLKVRQETVTYATITLQNYFRMYKKLAGMTGTAMTEAEEFAKIYRLEVLPIPTHHPMVRKDHSDYIFTTEKGKWKALAKEIAAQNKTGRPILVGSTSIEKSELLSDVLRREGVPCEVMNAKQHEREAIIVAQAGRIGGVTVATNMAGRGTDIILGGNLDGLVREELRKKGFTEETAPADLLAKVHKDATARWGQEHEQVVKMGGLLVLGTERHEARRIDNQLRGRTGRQGDPGESRFYVALDDDLMRRFGGDRIKSIMNWAGFKEDEALENSMVSKAMESAQSKVEAHNFEIRKQLVSYDDVVNRHRDVIYGERGKIIGGADLKANVLDMVEKELKQQIAQHLTGLDASDWDVDGLEREFRIIFPLPEHLTADRLAELGREDLEQAILEHARTFYEQREQAIGPETTRTLERLVMLRVIDTHWVEHLTNMEALRQGIGMHSAGQRDPLVAYRTEGHESFERLLERMQRDIVRTIYHAVIEVPQVQVAPAEQRKSVAAQRQPVRAQVVKPSPMAALAGKRVPGGQAQPVVAGNKVGRNDPCPCGSGKKYKRCHQGQG
ncbi:MAG: preprotein translocase subunit SecA [Dehalococcoidia bacterium]|nr:preprotein translocase subunit SecA [Dehalococcoidia bacterium]